MKIKALIILVLSLISVQAFAMTVEEFDSTYGKNVLDIVTPNLKSMTYSECNSLEKTRKIITLTCSNIDGCYTALYDWVNGPNPGNCLWPAGRSNQQRAKELYLYLKGYIELRNKLLSVL